MCRDTFCINARACTHRHICSLYEVMKSSRPNQEESGRKRRERPVINVYLFERVGEESSVHTHTHTHTRPVHDVLKVPCPIKNRVALSHETYMIIHKSIEESNNQWDNQVTAWF